MATEVIACEQEQWNCENDNDNDGEDTYSLDERLSVQKGSTTGNRIYFTSNIQNSFIRNAITGVHYPFKVGSKASRNLFKVVDTRGIYDVNGKKLYPPRYRMNKKHTQDSSHSLPNPNSNNLYYDTPEEYLRHFNTKQRITVDLNPDFVKSWHERRKGPLDATSTVTQ